MFVQWNPWRELNRLEREMNAAMGTRAASRPTPADDTMKAVTWEPAVDVYEDADKILLVADLPGVEESDVSISVDRNLLTLKGERKLASPSPRPDPKTEPEGFRRIERVQGPFIRAFTLPATVETDRVAAELKSGVLTLTLPKRAEAQPKQIKIAVA